MALTQITEKGIKDGEIINADINASAAIAGSKISPNFGSQVVSTTGDLTIDTNTLHVDASNNFVGIGTASPSGGKLHISHANELGIYTLGGYNYQAKFESTDAEAAIVIEDNGSTNDGNRIGVISDNMEFTTANSPRMRIDSSGNVGINTTNPDGNKLKIQLSDTATDSFVVKGGSSQLRTNINLDAGNNDSTGFTALRLRNSSGSAVGSLSIQNSSNDLSISSGIQGGEIQIKTSSTANALGSIERIRVDDDGNVGLGISTPSTLLHQHVSGSGANYHKFTNSTTGSAGTDGAYIGLDHAEQFIMWTQETGKLRFAVGDNEKVYINNDGHLGINDGNLVIGTHGHGIDFSAAGNATNMTSELLDDYEEGTWSSTNLNFDFDGNQVQRGHYLKVGRLVHAFFRIKFHNQTTHVGDHLRFTGLPFAAASGTPYDINVGGFAPGYASIDFFRIYVSPGSSYAYWYTSTGNAFNNSTSMNGADIRGCIVYTASA